MNRIPLFNVEPGANGRAFTRVTLEDLFAAAAFMGILAANTEATRAELAAEAYALARAMMEHRAKDPGR